MPDNQDPQVVDNQDPKQATDQVTADVQQPGFSWKSHLNQDYANSPTMQLFEDNEDGFNNAIKSHLELQKMMGHDKVPVPKGPEDLAAMDIFKKAFNIPADASGYQLPDAEMPDSLKGVTLDKDAFGSIIHRYNLTPEQAKGVWKEYTESFKGVYAQHTKEAEARMTEIKNEMRQEWGDAYDTKVELGQMVINKFSDDEDMTNELTATLSQSPAGIKWLAKIGEQFAENKIGDFKYQKHALTPDEAEKEIAEIRRDLNHPYNNAEVGQKERDRAIDYVNSLYSVIAKAKQQ